MRAWAFRLSLVFIFTIPWETAVVSGFGTLSRVAGIMMAAVWILAVLRSGHVRRVGLLHLLAGLFLLWNAASVLWSVDVTVTVVRVISIAQMVLLLVILWDLYRTPGAVRAGLQAYVFGACVIEGSLILTFLNDPEILRYQALGENANGTGVILALGIPVAWYLAASAPSSTRGHIQRVLDYIYLVGAVFCIALTATRFVMLMAVPGMLFGAATLSRLSLAWRSVVFVSVCITLLWLPTTVPERSLERLGTVDDEIASGDLNRRTVFWKEAIEVWKEHPLQGVGAAAFQSIAPSGRSAHNAFIGILADLGLIGLLLYGGIWATVLFQALAQPKWESRLWLTFLVALFIASNALAMWNSKGSWLFFGLLAASWGLSPEQRSSSPPSGLGAGHFRATLASQRR
ncbi:MAG: O-antigen ligase family protein [Acidobacteriota bacterium]|nr:O-antigen ligase family protein [Acidobacteriota bacterium]